MKTKLSILLLVLSGHLSGQVIRSNTTKISIRDHTELKKDYWTIVPAVRPDIYETVSSEVPHNVTFITDIDSISFDVALNQKFSFVILLNGKDSAFTQIAGVKQLSTGFVFAPPTPFTSSQIKQLSKLPVPFNRVQATPPGQKPDDADLAAFGNAVGNAQLIALGESTHGTSEFFRLKHRALEYAVRQLHVRVFALEDNQLNVERVNNYVLYGKGNLLKIMRGLFGVWVRQEVLDMIEWVRQYNLAHPQAKVEFVGFDMQSPVLAFDSLHVFLSQKSAQLNTQIQGLLSDYKKGFPNAFAAGDPDKLQWYNNTQKALDIVRAEKAGWLREARNKADSVSAEWALQNATVIMQSARSILTGQMKLYRDSAMAENIKWILSMRKPGTRMLIWAHDFHISRGDHPVAADNYYNGISMGSWLSKWYGDQYKAFGLETYAGEFTAMKTYTDFDLVNCPLVNAPAGTLDEALHQIAVKKRSPYLFLNLAPVRSDPKKFKWLCGPTYVRFANHVCEGNSYGLKHAIPFQFDGIFFIDQTTGSLLIR